MYDRKGKYQWLDPVSSEDFDPALTNPAETKKEFHVTVVANDADAEKIAEKTYNTLSTRTPGGVARADYNKSLDEVMDDMDAALEQGSMFSKTQYKPTVDDYNNQFNEDLQDQIDGVLPKGHVYDLGDPNEDLVKAGIPDLPIELVASRLVDKAMQFNHPFDLDELRSLVKAINNPLAIFRSATHPGSFVVMTTLKHNGQNFVVVIKPRVWTPHAYVNSVRSVHYRQGMNFVNWINEGLVEYLHPGFEKRWLTPYKNELRSKPQYNSVDVRTQLKDAVNIVQEILTTKENAEKKCRKSRKKL